MMQPTGANVVGFYKYSTPLGCGFPRVPFYKYATPLEWGMIFSHLLQLWVLSKSRAGAKLSSLDDCSIKWKKPQPSAV